MRTYLISPNPRLLSSGSTRPRPALPGYTTLAFSICAFGLFYYILSISFFFKCLGPWMREKVGTAKTLRFWEYFVSLAWQIQTIGFWALTITPPVLETELEMIPVWLTTSLGIVLVVVGIGSKRA